jgi:Zn ribbon nucleic-acid-binding protein
VRPPSSCQKLNTDTFPTKSPKDRPFNSKISNKDQIRRKVDAFHLILSLIVQYYFLPFDDNVKSFYCRLLLCSIKRWIRILVSNLDDTSKFSIACEECNSQDSLSLTRYKLDELLYLQLIECTRCGYRWKEIWLSRGSLNRKKNRTLSPPLSMHLLDSTNQ